MEKQIFNNDIKFSHNGKSLLIGIRETDSTEILMVLGEVIDAVTFEQTWSSGYDRDYIKSDKQFIKEVFIPWANRFVVEKYGGFKDDPLNWWELIGESANKYMVWEPLTGFLYKNE